MGFGKNIQFLRRLYGKITQEELAEKNECFQTDNIKMGA